MISTFRAFASGVRELKTKDIHEFIKVKYKYLCYYQIGYYILLNFNQQMMVNFILRYFYLYFVWKKVLRTPLVIVTSNPNFISQHFFHFSSFIHNGDNLDLQEKMKFHEEILKNLRFCEK